jgi:hypothetical protein
LVNRLTVRLFSACVQTPAPKHSNNGRTCATTAA